MNSKGNNPQKSIQKLLIEWQINLVTQRRHYKFDSFLHNFIFKINIQKQLVAT